MDRSKKARSRPNPSIRAALMLAVCAAITPPSVIIILTGMENGRRTADLVRTEVLRQTDSFAEIQAKVTESARQMLMTLSASPAFRDGDRMRMAEILRSVHESNPAYLNISALDTDGLVTASSRLAGGTDLSGRLHFRVAVIERRFAAGEYILNRIDSTPSFAFAYPIFDSSRRVAGVLTAAITLDSYSHLFDRLNLPKDSFIGLVDRNGTRLFFYPPKQTNLVGHRINPSVWEKISAPDEKRLFLDHGSDGIQRIFAFKSLRLERDSEPYMYLVYATPSAAINASNLRITIRNGSLMFLVLVFALASSFLVSRLFFGRRLARIVDATTRIREGDLRARANLADDGSDLGQIGKALDLMAETIERRDTEKEEYARSLAASLAQKDILLKEIHHRVKNNLQMVLSLIRLQDDDSKNSGSFRQTIEARVSSMAIVHEMLYESNDMRSVDLGSYADRLIELITSSRLAAVDIRLDAEEVRCALDTAVPFGLILNELATNAVKHAFKSEKRGLLTVSIKKRDGSVVLEVADDGPGLPDDFTIDASSGLGLRLAQALSEQLGGTLTWAHGESGLFSLTFPLT